MASCWAAAAGAGHQGLQKPASRGTQGVGPGVDRQWVLVEGLGEEPAGRMEAVTPLTREEGACRVFGPVPGVQLVHARAEPTMRLLFQASCLLWAVLGGVGAAADAGHVRVSTRPVTGTCPSGRPLIDTRGSLLWPGWCPHVTLNTPPRLASESL